MKKNVNRKLAAGVPGTKKMVGIYGEDLVCVRYRYDAEKRIKYKTVEIIVDKGIWDLELRAAKQKRKAGIRVMYNESELRAKVKTAGGVWSHNKKVWELDYKSVKELGLTDRIVNESKNK